MGGREKGNPNIGSPDLHPSGLGQLGAGLGRYTDRYFRNRRGGPTLANELSDIQGAVCHQHYAKISQVLFIPLHRKNKCELPSQELDQKSRHSESLLVSTPKAWAVASAPHCWLQVQAGFALDSFILPQAGFRDFAFNELCNISYRDIFFLLLASF